MSRGLGDVYKRQLQNSHGDIKYSTGNGVPKELIHMTHTHEKCWGGLPEGVRGAGERGTKGEKLGKL